RSSFKGTAGPGGPPATPPPGARTTRKGGCRGPSPKTRLRNTIRIMGEAKFVPFKNQSPGINASRKLASSCDDHPRKVAAVDNRMGCRKIRQRPNFSAAGEAAEENPT